MATDDHGSCKSCGFDLNGRRVFDHFLEEYGGDRVKALDAASMYGCREGCGRFGKQILWKEGYGDGLPFKYICPECKEECY